MNKIFQKRVLSFTFDDEDDEEEDVVSVPLEKKAGVSMLAKICLLMWLLSVIIKKYNDLFQRVGMDPTVETAFLPDRNREKELAR